MSDQPRIEVGENDSQRVHPYDVFQANVFEPPASSEAVVWNISFDSSLDDSLEANGAAQESPKNQAQRLLDEARRTLDEARTQAEHLVEEARRHAEEIEAVAYQAGFEQGEEAGQRLSDQKTESAMRSLHAVLEEIEAQRVQLLRSSEERLIRVAFLIALKLIHRELHQDPSVVFDIVREAISRVQRASRLTLYVSPHDFKFIEGHLDELTALTKQEMRIAVEPDPNIPRGGCKVTSNTGEVDATIDSMIRNLQERLWEVEAIEAEETTGNGAGANGSPMLD